MLRLRTLKAGFVFGVRNSPLWASISARCACVATSAMHRASPTHCTIGLDPGRHSRRGQRRSQPAELAHPRHRQRGGRSVDSPMHAPQSSRTDCRLHSCITCPEYASSHGPSSPPCSTGCDDVIRVSRTLAHGGLLPPPPVLQEHSSNPSPLSTHPSRRAARHAARPHRQQHAPSTATSSTQL
jgi:hypothetical protein